MLPLFCLYICRSAPYASQIDILGSRRCEKCRYYRHKSHVTRAKTDNGLTGFATFEASLGGKWLELLSEIAPRLKRVAIMFDPDAVPVVVYMPSFEAAARSLKVELITAPVH